MKYFFLFLLSTTYTLADINQIFTCNPGGDSVNILLGENGQAEIGDNTQRFPGTYTYSDHITLHFSSLGYQDRSTQINSKHGLITEFQTPNLQCHAIAHIRGEAMEGKVECPKIKYIPTAGYQINYFEFYQNHMVRRFTKDIIFAGNGDTLFSETYGTYTLKGNKVWMYFGAHDTEKELTGTIQESSLIVNELEPDKGACHSLE